jgi:N-acetyl-anhydromuramyl-L-alanine amidase AmpD
VSPPLLKWVPSPNFNSRHGTRVDQIIIHDMEGTYGGSVAYFQSTKSNVSAHFCVREDGLETTQMVHLSDRAWHACAANSRSVGIEMAGYSKNGYRSELVQATASIAAWLCHYLQVPVRHARGGVGPGIESHWGLGRAGGGHSDPSTDPAWMDRFIELAMAEYAVGFDFHWIDLTEAKCCALAHPPTGNAPALNAAPDLSIVSGVQRALSALGLKIDADGVDGPKTLEAVRAFQAHAGLPVDGIVGPDTRAALQREVSRS